MKLENRVARCLPQKGSNLISHISRVGGSDLSCIIFTMARNLVPRAMPVRGLGWHWLWGN